MNETIKKILIVDDDPDITNTFSIGLEDTGLFAVETYNELFYAFGRWKVFTNFHGPRFDSSITRYLRVCLMDGLSQKEMVYYFL